MYAYETNTQLQVYASGRDIVILDGRLKHVQTLLGSDLGYGDTPINCVDCAKVVGTIAVAWGSDAVIFHPELLEDNQIQNNNEVGASICANVCL